ncbi:hypothetical protein JRO89_XS01G0169300 [Xanthoceras sorbifolium]|uniref:H/ACA ribonucleoprotein complex non-core subunit NAF1 n=1 Tax=Xanthoceras sorbifolium TaxID=99658 RepID=A0ABQ8IJK8_9ROSI|nr:hypothetical protein JRO89_XS01G0169300 [Xanthoceras sorbifolium]
MDGFVTEPTTEDQDCLNQASKIKTFRNPIDNFDSKISDLSLADSFLDFDSIKEFFENIPPNSDRISLENIGFGVGEKSLRMTEEGKTNSGDLISHGSDPIFNGIGCAVKVETLECEKEKKSSRCIEEEMGKVNLVDVKSEIVNDQDGSKKVGLVSGSDLVLVDGSGVKSEIDKNESKSSSESDDESSTLSSSSSSTSSDDEEEKEEVKMEVKRELNVAGPIKSKNELQVLPPVPEVNIALQPHHQMLPVGVVLSVLGAQVIVEGVEKHNPLNEGSILWITESRSPLGLIDEIFGPVKNPYYVVRYNSDGEVPAGIHVGTSISFVQEFADHVLNDKNLYKKGYDASGENDEEVYEEAEFSDDEKEAEYKRKLKMEKRGMNDQKPGNRKNNRKKVRNRDGTLENSRHSVQQMDRVGQLSQNQDQHHVSPVPANCASSSAVGQGFVGGTGSIPQFPPMAHMAGFTASLSGVWTNGMPSQQPQGAVFPNGFSSSGMPWHPQNYQQHPNQMPMMNSVPFLQQFDPSQRSLPNVALPGGQPNYFAGPTYAPWLGLVGQNGLNQMVGMGLPGQPVHPSINAGQPGLVAQIGLNQRIGMGFQCQPAPSSTNTGEHGVCVEQKNFQQPEAPQQFNLGASPNRGRKPYHRGGGHFAGRRGRGHSK